MTTDADRELVKKIAEQAREIAMRDERSLSVVAAELGLAAGQAKERERLARLAYAEADESVGIWASALKNFAATIRKGA